MFRLLFVAGSLAALMGCVPTNAAEDASEDTCRKATYASLIGRTISDAEMPQKQSYRVIYPDQAVTLEHVPSRVNFRVDPAGVVQGVNCG